MENIQQEIDKAMQPHIAKMNEGFDEIRSIKKELLSKQERDSKPSDVSVTDLEARLDEAEANYRSLQDTMRLSLTEVRGGKEEEVNPWAGAFVKNVEEVKQAVRQYGNLENAMKNRAIDTSVISSAGALSADQENQFMDWLIEKQMGLKMVRTYPMVAPTAYLDELVTAAYKIRAAVETTAPSVSDAFSTARRTLTVVESIGAEDVSLSFVENNIERGNINNHIARNIATGFGNDHELLFWNGNTSLAATITDTDTDAIDDTTGLSQDQHSAMRINQGIITLAKADAAVNDYGAGSDTTVQAILKGALKKMPYDYKARLDLDHTFFLPYNTAHTYADELTTRGTAFADQVLINGMPALRYFGLPVVGLSSLGLTYMSLDEGVFTPASNLVWGIQRGITLESEWRPRKRAWEYTITAKADANYAKSEAVVLIDGIASGLR